MTVIASCRENLAGHLEACFSYSNMEVLEYYDGPVEGVVHCGMCGTAYRFNMLDWDGEHEIRVFSLAPLPTELFLQFKEIISKQPKGIVPEGYDREAPYERSRQLLDQSGPVQFVVAWRRSDARVLAIRTVTDEDRGAVGDWSSWMDPRDPTADRDWFAFVGLDAGA
jgi:hypothetical protein